jgi:hypothetical protein
MNSSLIYSSRAKYRKDEEVQKGISDLEYTMNFLSPVENFRLCCAMAINELFFDEESYKLKIARLKEKEQDLIEQIDYVDTEVKLALSEKNEKLLRKEILKLLDNQKKINSWGEITNNNNDNMFLILHNLIEF